MLKEWKEFSARRNYGDKEERETREDILDSRRRRGCKEIEGEKMRGAGTANRYMEGNCEGSLGPSGSAEPRE